MLEETCYYNIVPHKIDGKRNLIADFLSRKEQGKAEAPEYNTGPVRVLERSRRLLALGGGIDIVDPLLQELAEMGSNDQEYMRDIDLVMRKVKLDDMPKDSELKSMSGSIQLLGVESVGEHRVIVKDSFQVMVPKVMRKEIMRKLHSSHLCSESMVKLARKSLFWPRMASDLKKCYQECRECDENRQAKVEKQCEVVPEDLTMLAPAEQVSMDHFYYNKISYLVIKDRASGYIYAEKVENTSTEVSVRVLLNFCHSYGYCHRVKTDGAGNFRGSFTSMLKGYGMEHVKSSANHPSSNGLAEAGVKSLKKMMKRDGKSPTAERLKEMCFLINNNIADEKSGSACEKFFRRRPKSCLPNSIRRELDHRTLVRARHDKQVALAKAKGYTSREEFKVGDRVVMRDHERKKWNAYGVVKEERVAEDGTIHSFIIMGENGKDYLRHKSHLRHRHVTHRTGQGKKDFDGNGKRVRFKIEESAEKEKEERRKSPRLAARK